ncbi:DnaA regulatory inactivator Hda [Sideroxydans sp. CL21]|uniref:DnaA regulatory inactivator Hda n=1 Tax=Sideroxydans sp. CL21 TaxID=2600596 RepID=UPI0024BC4300|nr:DnaA regulatory inactivator Hda [Sideroxydans sp. CL21]
MTQLLLGIAPEWIPTLDNFVSGRNVELLSVLRRAPAAEQGERGLYIWGETGSGKSHLLQAVVEQARASGLTALYARGEVPDAAQVVAIDDVERLDEGRQIDLFALYNRVRESGGMLVASGMQAPAFLSLRDDLRTRLGWGLVYQVHALSDTEKAQALQQHARARGFELPNEVTSYLLRHGRRDLPALLATLDALDEHCLRLKRAASVPLLKEVMRGDLAV